MTTAVMQTAVVPLLPTMSTQLGVGPVSVSWVVTANLLAAVVGTPVLTRLAERCGPRRVLLATLFVVMVGSLLCAATYELSVLITGRVLQGFAFAFFPIGVSIVRTRLGSKRSSGAIGIMSGILAVGGAVGMVAAGLLQTLDPDFRIVFWSLLALNFAAFAVGWAWVPRDDEPASRSLGGLDFPGVVLMAIGLSAMLIALAQGVRWGWASPATFGTLILGIAATVAWYLHERRAAQPIVPPALLSARAVFPVHVVATFVGIAMYVQFLGAAQFVQADEAVSGYGFNASVLRTSVMVLLPGAAAGVIAAATTGRLVQRMRAEMVMLLACAVGLCGFLVLIFFHDRVWQVIAALVIINVFVSSAYAALPAMLERSVPTESTGVANGINAIARTFGSSIASALVATLAASLTVSGSGGASETAYTVAFVIGGGSTTAAGLFAVATARYWTGTRSVDRGLEMEMETSTKASIRS